MAQHVKYLAHSRCSIKANSCSLIPNSPGFSCMIVLFSDLTFFSVTLPSSYIQTSQEARNILELFTISTWVGQHHLGWITCEWNREAASQGESYLEELSGCGSLLGALDKTLLHKIHEAIWPQVRLSECGGWVGRNHEDGLVGKKKKKQFGKIKVIFQ